MEAKAEVRGVFQYLDILRYTLFFNKELFIRNLEPKFFVKYNGFYVLLFPVTMENNRKFKELLVLGLEAGSL